MSEPDAPLSPPSLQQFTDLAELAGGFIHEIKNHLGTLSLNLQLLAEDFEDPQNQRERRAQERVTRLNDECARLLELSNDFLRFARVEDLETEVTSLDEVVTRMIDFLTPTARAKNIELTWYATPDLPMVRLDKELFEQALLNLMLNAEQAMPEGGTLTLLGREAKSDSDIRSVSDSVSVSKKEEAPKLSRSSYYSDTDTITDTPRWVCLDVIDTGQGMPPDVLEKIFRPFHTTKQNGSGLGLPTTRKIVLAHGGRIDVQSDVGRGTKFTITLPATEMAPRG